MDDVSTEMLSLFRALTRLRRVWHDARPVKEISKSMFASLMAIAHAGDEKFPDYKPVELVDGAISVKDLAALTQTTMPSISQRVSALEKLGYIIRIIDAADRRVCRVKLTKSGENVVKEAHDAMKKRMDKTIQEFGTENIEVLVAMLDKLSSSIETHNQEFCTNKENDLC